LEGVADGYTRDGILIFSPTAEQGVRDRTILEHVQMRASILAARSSVHYFQTIHRYVSEI
jgi:hypothetical protein